MGIRWLERPYEYVQNDVQRYLHRYLRTEVSEVRRICIVGAHLGYEVMPILRQFPCAEIRLFEASQRYVAKLKSKFASERRVHIYECAASDSDGFMTFYETNLTGSGSLLRVGVLARKSYGMEQAESFQVAATRLDTHAHENGYDQETIDCLWIDVQGAEMAVLRGAAEILNRTRSIFIEVSIFMPLYEGGSVFFELERYLFDYGFRVVSLGTDAVNGTGNAFLIRIIES